MNIYVNDTRSDIVKRSLRCIFSIVLILALGGFFINGVHINALENKESIENRGEEIKEEDNSLSPIKTSMHTFNDMSHFDGFEAKNPFDFSKFTSIEVTSSGGVSYDGEGEKSYSNFCTVNINVNTDSKKIIGTDYRLHRDFMKFVNTKWSEGKYNPKLYKLQNAVGLGACIISRENKDGSREVEKPIYFDGKDIKNLRFTEDGDYHVVLLAEISSLLSLIRYKCVFEYIIPVRTNVYIKDSIDDYDVKNAYGYYKPCYIDTMERRGVSVYIDNILQNTKNPEISTLGKHRVKIMCNGFVCERFDFIYFDPNQQTILDVYFKNIRKKLRDYEDDGNGHSYAVYEAESYVSAYFQTRILGVQSTAKYSKDGEAFKEYLNGEVLSEEGLYHFIFELGKLKYHVEYFVYVTENDNPSHNLDILNQNRFNNFISKWYEVDFYEAEDKYCFSMDEYSRALNLALSLENERVIDRGYEYFYDDKIYSSISELTPILSANAKKRISIQYFDNRSTEKKRMSNNLFDGTIYLNSDFMFTSPHPSEVSEVKLIDSDGLEHQISFNVELSNYNLKGGSYRVVESDIYGNKTEYEAIIDNKAPEVRLSLNNESLNAINNGSYDCRYFKIEEILDDLDKYAIIRVNEEFFLGSELNNAIFTNPGKYKISCYDRNNNEMSFEVNIRSTSKQYTITDTENGIKLNLNDGSTVKKVYLNGVEIEINDLTFNKNENESIYKIYIENTLGEEDLAVIRLDAIENIESGEKLDQVLPVTYQIKPWVYPTLYSILGVSAFMVAIYLIIKHREG